MFINVKNWFLLWYWHYVPSLPSTTEETACVVRGVQNVGNYIDTQANLHFLLIASCQPGILSGRPCAFCGLRFASFILTSSVDTLSSSLDWFSVKLFTNLLVKSRDRGAKLLIRVQRKVSLILLIRSFVVLPDDSSIFFSKIRLRGCSHSRTSSHSASFHQMFGLHVLKCSTLAS